MITLRRLGRAVEEAKRRVAKANKAQHAAEVAAAELKGKGEAERGAAKSEVAALTQQFEAAKLQVGICYGFLVVLCYYHVLSWANRMVICMVRLSLDEVLCPPACCLDILAVRANLGTVNWYLAAAKLAIGVLGDREAVLSFGQVLMIP